MFKVVNVIDGSDIVILDQQWAGRLDILRSLDRRDVLVCQECRQPVRVRECTQKRSHFAHKHRENCTLTSESPEILNARAVLYEKLSAVFGTGVTIEKKLDLHNLPRPIDCWVEVDGHRIAYWIFDKALGPQARTAIQHGMAATGATICWVFAREMLHPGTNSADEILLTTTERDFGQATPFEEIYRSSSGESLHYLDASEHCLTTYRALRCIHDPNLYHGYRLQHAITEVAVSQDSGLFIHPGENERLADLRRHRAEQERRRVEEEQRRTWEEEKRRAELEELRTRLEKERSEAQQRHLASFPTRMPESVPCSPTSSSATATGTPLREGEGICEYCGRRTTEWWSYDGKTGLCKCYTCSDFRRPSNTASTTRVVGTVSNACQKAKLLIQQAIIQWKTGTTSAPIIMQPCHTCGTIIPIPLPDRIDRAVLDSRLADGSIADVALLNGDAVVAVLFICDTPIAPGGTPEHTTMRYVVLDSQAIIADPCRWSPVTHNLVSRMCSLCKSEKGLNR